MDDQKRDSEQPRDKDEERSTTARSPSKTEENVGSGSKEEGSMSEQLASHDAGSEYACRLPLDGDISGFDQPASLFYQAPMESVAASSENQNKKADTEVNVNVAVVGEDCRLENAGSSDQTDSSGEVPDNPIVSSLGADAMFEEQPEAKFFPGIPIESHESVADVASRSPMVSANQIGITDHDPIMVEHSMLPNSSARSDPNSPMSPNNDLNTNKPLELLSAYLEDPSESTKLPPKIVSNNPEDLINTHQLNVQSPDVDTKVDDDQEAHSPFPCLENLEDCMPFIPPGPSQGFQVDGGPQEDGRLSDKSSCNGEENLHERTDEPEDSSQPKPIRNPSTLRRMSNCSDLSDDDSEDDQCDVKRDIKRQSSDLEDSDGEPSLVRHGQPCSPELPDQGRHSPHQSQTRIDFNGILAGSPHEDISSDSINLNSSAERLGPAGTNRSEEERDGLVEITDEEMSNYERKWEMEKKLVENTELEGLEAISDVESSGQKSKSDDEDNSEVEQLGDGLETISDLEAEAPKAEKQGEEYKDEDTPKHQPSVPDDTPDDTQNEEEGEIRDDDAPVPWKKITNVTKERSYRGTKEPGKEISKEIISKDRNRRVGLDRLDGKISSNDRGRKTHDDSSSPSSSSTSSSESPSRGKERSVSRVKRKRSRTRTRTRSKDRDRAQSRDQAKDKARSRDRDRDRDRDRIRSRERARDKSIDRNKDRSRSRVSRDRYRRDRSRDRRSRSRDRKRRRTRSPRKERSRSRDRSRRSRDRKRTRRSPSVSSSSDCSTCSCSSCEREEMRRQKQKDRRGSRDRDRSKNEDKSKRDRSPRSKKRPGPSKEVFTSGDNILVSVNFKKDGEGNKAKEAPPAERKRERKKDEKERPKKDRKESKENKPVKRKESPKKVKKKKKIDTSNMKTVAIIDLDTSPFRVTSPINELIILTDSDGEDKTSKVDPRMGPRTPPEPQMKFTLAAKKQQVRNMANPLLSMERDMTREEDLSHAHRGPNTPPEPEIRSPYDPFEPTKSPTPEDGRGRQSPNQETNQQVPQVSLTPPRARPQHVAPATPSPLHSPPSTLDQQDRPKLMPFQPVPVDSGDDSPGGGGGVDSPYSPGSSEGDDLFDPPQQLPPPKPMPRVPLPMALREHPSKHAAPPPKNRPNNAQKDAPQKVSNKKEGGIKIDENQQKLLDDLPNSAVEMQFIEKLHRQERVVEEVKLILKPHYAKKHVNKDEYKEILRRAVPKICHSRTGEINPIKIQKLIDAYVQRFRHKKKLAAGGGGGSNPNPSSRQNKPVVIK